VDETLLRDRVEIERRRDEARHLDRVNAIERALAVLQTVFDAHREHAITANDLSRLQREVEAEMNKQISHICDHFDNQTKQQSADILSRVELMFGAYQTQNATAQLEQSRALLDAQQRTRAEIIRYGVGFALTVLSGLTLIWLTK
jgi:hypothetical protein